MKHVLNTLIALGFLFSTAACSVKAGDVPNWVSPGLGEQPTDEQKATAGFSEWQNFAGSYTLLTFDNRDVSTLRIPSKIELDTKSVRDKSNSFGIRMVKLPLYTMVDGNTGSSSNLEMGPLEGLGTYTKTMDGETAVYEYSFAGPVMFEYQLVELKLNIKMRVTDVAGKNLLVFHYVAEIPKYVSKTERTFTLSK